MNSKITLVLLLTVYVAIIQAQTGYPLVNTKQDSCYDTLRVIAPPTPGAVFYGQDAQFNGNQPSYRDNGDGTVSDLVTGLMWVQERGTMTSVAAAIAGAASCRIGGDSDWRMPTIKELHSLIDFRGFCQTSARNSTPCINMTVFGFACGDTINARLIDCQDRSGTRGATEQPTRTLTSSGVTWSKDLVDRRRRSTT